MAEVAPEIIAPGFVRHDLAGAWLDVAGPGGVTDFISMLRAAMPDLKVEIEDLFAAGDRVALRLVMTGTHRADLLGVAGTGRQIKINGVNIYRVEAGKLAETWQLADIAGSLAQIGD